jgi:C4-dicarboxylate-specific signal transduction histidine kinase
MLNSFNVLYVEDEEMLQTLIRDVFGKEFKSLYSAYNGLEGLELYKANQENIDLIITDINMPHMDGLEMCKSIRELNSSIPIIITTAFNDVEFLHSAISIGVTEFVLKPVDVQNLYKTIQKSLEPVMLKRKLDAQTKQREEERVLNAKFAAIGQLAAGITHEINTPLTYIKGTFEILEYNIEKIENNEKTKKSINENIERINDGLMRIESIVGSMKEMSFQSGVKKEQTNIYSTVVMSSILAFNKIKHIAHVYINGDLFDLNMDKEKYNFSVSVQKQRIEQVWVIIINNALDELIKTNNFDQNKIEIDIQEEEKNVIVAIKDNGGGIKQEILPRIFEPFKGTKESSGMGVGLSIAKKIILENDGQIDVFNENGGAVFRVTLPKGNSL